MFKVLINYNFTPDKSWIGDEYLIYDRSDDEIDHLKDFDQSKIIRTENTGQVDFDKLTFLAENYETLPDVFLWGKTNLFKYITREEYEKVKDNKTFTPLLTQGHKTYNDSNGAVCYYSGGMYYERNDSWYLNQFQTKYFFSYKEFADSFQLTSPSYLPFAPGGNYILTREKVHRYSRDFYAKMASVLPYCREPGEAQMCERSYFNIWK
jgi:hypothetical protein